MDGRRPVENLWRSEKIAPVKRASFADPLIFYRVPMRPTNFRDHPEGGRFEEVFRSAQRVAIGVRERSALTHIYFELRPGELSGFHRVSSDEVWNLYRGDGVRLFQWDGQSAEIDCIELCADADEFCHVVPAGFWQAAEPIGDAVLVGCSVGPGFEFDDFEMMETGSRDAERLLAIDPTLARFVKAVSS